MQRGPPADAWSFRVGIRLRKCDVLNQLWIDITVSHNSFDDMCGKILGSYRSQTSPERPYRCAQG
ncbi:Uncharacterised protein [Mycobacteroides abscessus subsp. abscessus]|nr:Uncharacterised protein [Mycobacteroides abscessus subsp. abscessus]